MIKKKRELKIQATNGLTVKENGEYEKWPVEAGKDSKNVITFADEAGNASFSFLFSSKEWELKILI